MSAPKINTPPPSAPPAPAVAPALASRQLGDEERAREDVRRKRGRNSLRIDPQSGGVNSAGGSGINVPMK